jgi:hypothetical protein
LASWKYASSRATERLRIRWEPPPNDNEVVVSDVIIDDVIIIECCIQHSNDEKLKMLCLDIALRDPSAFGMEMPYLLHSH